MENDLTDHDLDLAARYTVARLEHMLLRLADQHHEDGLYADNTRLKTIKARIVDMLGPDAA